MKYLSKSRLKRFILFSLALLLILVISSPFIINQLVNSSFTKQRILSIIQQETGKKIDPETFIISLFPQPSLRADRFTIQLNEQVRLDIERLDFVLSLDALFQKEIKVDQISIDRPSIHAVYKGKTVSGPVEYTPSFSELGDQIDKIFSYLPATQDAVSIQFTNVEAPFFDTMNGSVDLSRKTRQIILNHSIRNFNLTTDLLNQFGLNNPFDMKQFSVNQLNSILTIDSFGQITGESRFQDVTVLGKTNNPLIKTDFFETRLSLSDDRQHLQIPQFNLQSPLADLGFEFDNDLVNQTSSITFKGANVHIESVRKNALELIKNNRVVNRLFSVLKGGFANQVQVSFSSPTLPTLIDEHHLNLNGTVEKGIVRIPETQLVVSDVTADVTLQKGVLGIQAHSGLVEKSKIKKGRLDLDLMNYEDYPFKGNFHLDVDLSRIPSVLIALLPDSLLTREMAKVSHVVGRTNAVLGLDWETKTDYPKVIVTTTDTKASGQYQRIPGKIQIDSLRFSLKEDVIKLDGLTGSLLNSQLNRVNAQINLEASTQIGNTRVSIPHLNIDSGTGRLSLSTALPWLLKYKKPGQILHPLTRGDGILQVDDIQLSGPVSIPEQWAYAFNGEGQAIDLFFKPLNTKILNTGGIYRCSNDQFDFTNGSGTLSDLNLLSSFFEKPVLDSIRMPLHLKKTDIKLKDKGIQFKSDVGFQNGPVLGIHLDGESIDQLGLTRFSIKDGDRSDAEIIPIAEPPKKAFTFKGMLDFSTLEQMMIPNSQLEKKLSTYTQNQPVTIRSDAKNELHVTTSFLNLDPLISSNGDTKMDQQYLPDHVINFKADAIRLKKLDFKSVQSRLALKPDHSYFRIKNASLCDIDITGYLNFKEDLVIASFPFTAVDRTDLLSMLSCLLKKENLMDGEYTLNGDLSSSGPKSSFSRQLTGNLDFEAKNGRIYKLTLLSRILSVLNVSSLFKGKIPNILQTGFAYNTVTVKADLKGERVHLDHAVIDGADMTMIFSGWIDPFNDDLELTCLVAPFKTIDVIIKHIPIISTLLGERLISVPVKATGKLSDPTVIPLHPSLVGKGIIDKMSGVLKTPVRLWDKLYQKE